MQRITKRPSCTCEPGTPYTCAGCAWDAAYDAGYDAGYAAGLKAERGVRSGWVTRPTYAPATGEPPATVVQRLL